MKQSKDPSGATAKSHVRPERTTGKKEAPIVRKSSGAKKASVARKAPVTKKERRLHRREQKDNYALLTRTKAIWEQLRR